MGKDVGFILEDFLNGVIKSGAQSVYLNRLEARIIITKHFYWMFNISKIDPDDPDAYLLGIYKDVLKVYLDPDAVVEASEVYFPMTGGIGGVGSKDSAAGAGGMITITGGSGGSAGPSYVNLGGSITFNPGNVAPIANYGKLYE